MKKSKQFLFVAFIVVLASSKTIAADSYTNWNDLVLGLTIQKTNFAIGDSMPADIIISNATSKYHLIRIQGHPCDCGFGTFIITDKSSGKTIKCAVTDNDMSSSSFGLYLHRSKTFQFDLKYGYGITNTGDYSVQASGWFPLQEPPNGQFTNIFTPPITITLSKKTETNALQK